MMGQGADTEANLSDVLDLLCLSDDEVKCAQVDIKGVPAYGIIGSGSDITIMRGGFPAQGGSGGHAT